MRFFPLFALSAFGALGVLAGCSSGSTAVVPPSHPVNAAAPPKDDGKPAQGGEGGDGHAAALEQLKIARSAGRIDKQNSVSVQLPDAGNWTRVRFWGVPSLVGFRYGKDHHAIVAAFVTHVDDNSVQGACTKSFEAWAQPWVDAFDVAIQREPPEATAWHGQIVDIDSVYAKTATVIARDEYAAAYAAYPAWGKGSCLIVGVAVPSRGEPERAREVRDRFVKEMLPHVTVIAKEEPKERY
jgi:hypothetical protein